MRQQIAAVAFVMALTGTSALADEFKKTDVARWQEEYDSVAKKGRELWTSGAVGTNGVACAQCHPNAANTHPETYPKFQKQLGKVAQLWEMVNWCIRNPLQGQPLAADDPKMTALLAYIHSERRGVKLEPGKH
ncbi:c-type cytochrome [Methylocystis parvus]|uniref:Cytochrome C n=1 Tax=Methylocystis parvus TaxID=134 RepID=A0A6B8M8P0_9HYPH|nr:cytochrome c [Methylocystis parvus]QGM98966.1 cytochrome C [Methylocystis parvus]WBK00674.1 cytochrome C [Methylocystis parvus OBBP]